MPVADTDFTSARITYLALHEPCLLLGRPRLDDRLQLVRLSLVLCRAAASLGSLDALTAGRPGSWEAELVDRLARGLAFDDDGLAAYRPSPYGHG